MIVYINGETRHYADNTSVAEVIADLELTNKKIAIE